MSEHATMLPNESAAVRKTRIVVYVVLAAIVLFGFVACYNAVSDSNAREEQSYMNQQRDGQTVSGDLNSPENQASIRAGAIKGLRQSGCLPAGWVDGDKLPNPPLHSGCPKGGL